MRVVFLSRNGNNWKQLYSVCQYDASIFNTLFCLFLKNIFHSLKMLSYAVVVSGNISKRSALHHT